MTERHLVALASSARFAPPGPSRPARTADLRRWSIVDESVPGAVHTGFGICALAPGGSLPARVHSYEEAVFMLSGAVALQTTDGTHLLQPGDYALVPVGMPHAWHNDGEVEARWADMIAAQARARRGGDNGRGPWTRRARGQGASPVE